jgi:cytidine deaminase
MDQKQLAEAAASVRTKAYAPYSGFRVGAALRGSDGGVFVGCNVENSAYPSGLCAERGAVASAVANGVRQFDLLVISTEADEPTPPCGFCRQVLVEFAPSLEIVSVTHSGRTARWSLAELLPQPFTPASLAHE